jgi:hypothetical protein
MDAQADKLSLFAFFLCLKRPLNNVEAEPILSSILAD